MKPIHLYNSTPNTDPLKRCSRCDTDQCPGGGIEANPGKWICATCWKARFGKKREYKK